MYVGQIQYKLTWISKDRRRKYFSLFYQVHCFLQTSLKRLVYPKSGVVEYGSFPRWKRKVPAIQIAILSLGRSSQLNSTESGVPTIIYYSYIGIKLCAVVTTSCGESYRTSHVVGS